MNSDVDYLIAGIVKIVVVLVELTGKSGSRKTGNYSDINQRNERTDW